VLILGLTGGIGSGKTVVCKIFSCLGISIYYADDRAKNLINTIPAIKNEIIKAFGTDSFTSKGYNTKYIANLVFSDEELLRKLNAIVHPQVALDFDAWCVNQQHSKYVIQESAVLLNKKMNRIIAVEAPMEIRIDRLKKRNGLSEEEIKGRIRNQPSVERYNSLADWIIHNDDINLVIPQVLNIHSQIINIVSSNG
jgi:dephospho-CoA kinase